MHKLIVLLTITGTMFGQAPAPKPQTAATVRKPAVAAKPRVDAVIELVANGMSEGLVIKQLQREGKSYALTTPDLLKLQKAGVSENIINVMMDPKTTVLAHADQPPNAGGLSASKDTTPGGAALAPAPPPPPVADIAASTAADTPYPADLPNLPPVRKRRVVVAPFGFGASKDPSQAAAAYSANPWIAALQYRSAMAAGATGQNMTEDIGKGLQSMIMNRLQQANVVTVLERNSTIDDELKRGVSAQTSPGSRPALGHSLGADCIVTGDITIFGRDDKTMKKGGGALGLIPWKGVAGAGWGVTKKEEKAVVALELRLVDAETSEVLLPIHVRGVSKRESKSLGLEGLGIGQGGIAGGGFGNTMNSSNFANTILGEATIAAVDQIVRQVQEKIPQLPVKPRKIEGRVASITPNGVYMALGSHDGVLLGDR
ncbi:MAG TPA: CsgG/HfaB family protein, partial [Candidatus Angelobacter sp.]|nr:CsgG/HfaB family protein [Candidatus Angelobacter sp.]